MATGQCAGHGAGHLLGGGSTSRARSTAQIALVLTVKPQDLHLSTTATGYEEVSTDTAPDMQVSSGMVEVSVSQSL
ncbi:hypothetical protein BJ986_001978 [Phycicoccus badiiscoriae]|uniref:Uncharacterized protein n=1 Tax=Pedococcus badiiscoriae TaxID=642776 RepID=A0A852WIQ7_9MICO|nr:hypothetical protein [Pedococcus badiiscoriae]NYG07491.1 hypothetical protein [Pedococcus badiiscoriae]